MTLMCLIKRRIWIPAIFIILLPVFVLGQTGQVFDNLSMTSKILKSERKYAIYVPPDYDTSQRSYPVLYLLHGSGDDQTGWIQFGEVMHIADKTIKNGDATPMIIIMPDANTGKRGYWNDISGEWRYEDFFFEEFVPYIEKTYRIKNEKRYRAIAGLSMGGEGTFTYALHRPDMFSSACPLSAATGPKTPKDVINRMKRYDQNFDDNLPDSLVNSYYKRQSALYLVENLPKEQLTSVRWYIDCGDDDFLYEGNSLIHIALRKKDIPHEYRVRDGSHNWTYWRTALPEVLKFVSQAFHQY